jgi:hypothetical protein
MTLAQEILFALKEAETPLATTDLLVLCRDLNNPRQRLWHELRKLYDKNLILKAFARSSVKLGQGANQRVAIWRLA